MKSRAPIHRLQVPLLLLLIALPSAALAQGEMTGIRAMGMGEAFTASATGTGALFHNPAGISALMMYSIESSYLYDQATGLSVLHASVVDGKSNPSLGGGIGYSYSVSSSDAELPGFSGHDLYGALSAPIVPGWVIAGLGIHYLDYTQFDEGLADGITLDVGTMLALGDYLSFGAAVRNLLEVDDSGLGLEAAFGVAFHSRSLHVSGETVVDFTGDLTTDIHLGCELMLMGRMPIRFGYQILEATSDQLLSGGLGWRDELLGLDILYRQSLETSADRVVGLAIDLYL